MVAQSKYTVCQTWMHICISGEIKKQVVSYVYICADIVRNITIAVMVKQAEGKYKIALALKSELHSSHYQLRWQAKQHKPSRR